MKKAILSAAFILIALLAFPQWEWRNPYPFGNYLKDVYFPNENTGYITGSKGLLLKTTDAGLSWEKIETPTEKNLKHVWFANSETDYVTGEEGFIMKTTDGGSSWLIQESGTTEVFNDIFFLNENIGYIAGMNGQLLRTTNGGETWNRAFISIYSDVYSVHFVNSNVGYAAASMRTVYKTVDGGNSWTSTSGDPYLNLLSIYFLDANIGYVAGQSNFMMKTTNGGNFWTHFQSNRPIEKMQFINELTGYALSYNELVKTINGGTTWNPVGMEDCLSFCFSNPNTVYGVGGNGRLLKSEDSGVTSTNYTFSVTNANLEDVHFPDENTGYIVSQYDVGAGLRYGQVLKTTDGGDTWLITADGDFGRLTSVFFTDVNTGYMVCGYGKIYKTTDGGYLWDTLAVSYDNYLSEIVFVNSNTGFIAGQSSNGIILKTNDAGTTWQTVYEGSSPVRGIHFIDENIGYGILYSSILKTINGGMSWTETPINQSIILDVFFLNQDIGYVCGYMGLHKTTDGGETWTELPGPWMGHLINIFFVDENTGYISGDGGSFYQTNDGGLTWTNLRPTPLANSTLWFTNNLTGIAVCLFGNIFKTTNGGQVSADQSIYKNPQEYSLYPNPASKSITISSEYARPGENANIRIFSCDGKLMLNQKCIGIPCQLDVATLSSGLYLLKIQTNGYTETRKLVISK